MLLPLSLPSVSKDLFPLPHLIAEPGICLILYKTACRQVTCFVLRVDHLHHGNLDPHCSGCRRFSLSASPEDWQATKESPSRPTNTTIDWQSSPGMNEEVTRRFHAMAKDDRCPREMHIFNSRLGPNSTDLCIR